MGMDMDRKRDIAMRAAARVMDRIERDGALHKDAIADEVLAALAIEAQRLIMTDEDAARLAKRWNAHWRGGELHYIAPSICGERPPEQIMPKFMGVDFARPGHDQTMLVMAGGDGAAAGFGIVADPETVRDAVETMRREYGCPETTPEMVRRAESADAVRQGKAVVR